MKNISNWDLVLSPVFQCIAKKEGDFWCENSVSVISGTGSQLVFVFTDGGGVITHGQKEGNQKQLEATETG